MPPREIISYVLDREPLFPANQGYNYSDSNYLMVGLIIEKATESTYYSKLDRRIINKFALENTFPQVSRDSQGVAPGYLDPSWPFVQNNLKTIDKGKLIYNLEFEWTGGGLISNVKDLARWAKILYGGKLSKDPYLNELLEIEPSISNYGLGVIVWESSLGPMVGHSGTFFGYRTIMTYFPEWKISVALQFNRAYDLGDISSHSESLGAVVVQHLKIEPTQ